MREIPFCQWDRACAVQAVGTVRDLSGLGDVPACREHAEASGLQLDSYPEPQPAAEAEEALLDWGVDNG